MREKPKQERKRGFTLVELLIVITIIGILFVVLISKVNSTTEKAKVTGVKTDFRSFYLATENVAKNYDQLSLSTFEGFVTAFNESLDKRLAFDVPEDGDTVTYCKADDPWGVKYTLAYKYEENTVEVLFNSNAGGNTSLAESFNFGYASADNTKNLAVLTLAMGIKNNKVLNLKEDSNNSLVDLITGSDVKDENYIAILKPGLYNAEGGLIQALSLEDVGTDASGVKALVDADSSITKVVLPEGVTSIGSYAFYCCSGLTSVTIPNSVTSIGSCAFYACISLNSVTIPDSVTCIANSTFYYCYSLTSVIIPDSVTSIDDYAFESCLHLTSVTIPDSVKSIGKSAFAYCEKLTSVTIPDSVKSIGESAFAYCEKLTSVTIPDSVTSIGDLAFQDCLNLTSAVISDNVTSISNRAFQNVPNIIYKGSATGSPWGAKAIDGYVENDFVYSDSSKTTLLACTDLTSVIIPNSITSIGDRAFGGCTKLTSVSIPDSVTSIGNYAFDCCRNLTLVSIPDSVTSIGDLAFQDSGLTSVIIPDKVTSIGDHAFCGCTKLASVTIPDSVTSIKRYAFYKCSGLTSVTIPNRVTSIGKYAFAYCTGLTSVTISYGVTSIEMGAFADCTGLTSVTIPNSVTSIDDYAFKNVPKIYYNGSATGARWGAKSMN